MSEYCQICKKVIADIEETDVEIRVTVHDHIYKFLVCRKILHDIMVHGFSPSPDFVDAICHGTLIDSIQLITKPGETLEQYLPWYISRQYSPIGYTLDSVAKVKKESGFVLRLKEILAMAEKPTDEI